MNGSKLSSLAGAIAIAAVLGGCSPDQQTTEGRNGTAESAEASSHVVSSEQAVADRVDARWLALINADFAAAYSFESPGYRDAHTLKQYRARFGQHVAWSSAEVSKVEINGDDADVRVLVRYKAAGPDLQVVEGIRPLEEKWVKIDNNWWHIFE